MTDIHDHRKGSRAGGSHGPAFSPPAASTDSAQAAGGGLFINQGHTDKQLEDSARACFWAGIGFILIVVVAIVWGA